MVKNKKLTECKKCGFPKEWKRDLIILDDGIDSLMRVVKDDEYRCSECKCYKDGSTIKKLKPLLREYLELGKKQVLEKVLILIKEKRFALTDAQKLLLKSEIKGDLHSL